MGAVVVPVVGGRTRPHVDGGTTSGYGRVFLSGEGRTGVLDEGGASLGIEVQHDAEREPRSDLRHGALCRVNGVALVPAALFGV